MNITTSHPTIAYTTAALAVVALALPFMVGATGVTPSTNDENRDNGWAHANVLSAADGEIEFEFVSTRGFFSCFEYRTDGDTSQQISTTNPNVDITDGQYPFVCVNNSTNELTLQADEFVEIRMVFGAERDERFDWTRFDVPQPEPEPQPENRMHCMRGGWEDFGFKNQGRCIQFVETGKDSR